MLTFDISTLLGKLNETATISLTAAIGSARARGHKYVQIEHWLLALLNADSTDFVWIIRHFEVDEGLLSADLLGFLDRLAEDDAHFPSIHSLIKDAICQAWSVASLSGTTGSGRIRSGHLLIACLGEEAIADKLDRVSLQFRRINLDALRKRFDEITARSLEARPSEVPTETGPDTAAGRKADCERATPALDRFTVDLTSLARDGKIDPVLGRDQEIRQIIDILMRRRQNNPILTGEAGVGKTAVVEGFALRVARSEVPSALAGVVVRSLDLGLLQAGASVKGEFENRLVQVIEEVRTSLSPVILFIDEAHTLIGAGGQAGQNDAANLLKPALARGDLRTIAATTWAEYKKYFERDAALTRRFQVVKIEEPDESVAVDMLRSLVPTLQGHHKVRILEEALTETVRLSRRYIPARQLPDKAVSVLDTACARVAMTLSATPAVVEDERRRIERIDVVVASLRRELAVGQPHEATIAALGQERESAAERLATLEKRWTREKTLAESLNQLRRQLESGTAAEGAGTEYAGLERELAALQGDAPVVLPTVDKHAVAAVIAAWTGIPIGRMGGDEIRTVLALRDRLTARIIGQDQALSAIAEAVVMSRAKLTDPRKPTGVFLMVGTSGVGKTETALALSELLYGGEQNLTVINMSEFKEEHKISMLLGSPPGYVGYGEGGVLTEAVRRRPYGAVLLDEMEKAHPSLQDLFYQVFDKGSLRDGEGRDIDFKNTIIIMTSNAATDLIASLCADPETAPDSDGLIDALRPELLKIFKPAFLGRTTIVPYFPLSDAIIRQIVTLQLDRIARRVRDNYQAEFRYAEELVERIAARCHESESGARVIERILAHGLLPDLSAKLLLRIAAGDMIRSIQVTSTAEGGFQFEIS